MQLVHTEMITIKMILLDDPSAAEYELLGRMGDVSPFVTRTLQEATRFVRDLHITPTDPKQYEAQSHRLSRFANKSIKDTPNVDGPVALPKIHVVVSGLRVRVGA